MSNRKQGLEGYSRDPGFGQNTERDSGNVNGIHNLTAIWKAGFAKVWAQSGARDWNENDFRDSEDIRDSSEKGAGMRDRDPSLQGL